jgi:hypothetical protein
MTGFILKLLRKAYSIVFPPKSEYVANNRMYSNKSYSNDLIYKHLVSDEPCMISRFGSTEMNCVVNYMGIHDSKKDWVGYIKGKSLPWWWESGTINQMKICAGFFSPEIMHIERFCELMIEDIKSVDILGSWLQEEVLFDDSLQGAKRVPLEDLEPFFSANPWTRALKNKKVLVVHPFADTIERQYQKRELLFDNGLLPDFDLITIKAVQSAAGEKPEYDTWFDALDAMKMEIDSVDFDICILGCGAYGLPLAAHIKRQGKKAVHLGGVTQMLFGIKGKRWEQFIVWPYANMFNEHWIRPGQKEKPKSAALIEDACYW